MLIAQNITLAYGGKTVLQNVNLHFPAGELCLIMGANGAGKSSLLQLLSGERQPTQGQVLLDQKALASWPGKQLAQRRAVMPQSGQIAFPLTVGEVVEMGCFPYGQNKASAGIVTQCLAMLDITHLIDRYYPTLSGGEQQRVHLARVLAQLWPRTQASSPCYLLLDEFTSALDLAFQHLAMRLVRERVRAQGVGVVAIVHDVNLAAQYADRVVLLAGGRILDDGSPWQVLTRPNMQTVFDVEMNVIPHPHREIPVLVH